MDLIRSIIDMLRGRRIGASISFRFGGPDRIDRPCVQCGRTRADHAGVGHRFESPQQKPSGS